MVESQRSVVVTGAASGIGLAIVTALENSGRVLWAADVSAETEPASAASTRVHQRRVDVTDAGAVDDLVAEACVTAPLEAAVACAGISCPGPADEPVPERWERTLAVNALGAMHLIRSAIPPMREAGTGTIVVIASASGRLTYVGEPAYVASKHAIVAFADCVRKELAGTGIRVCVVEPGLVDTPMTRSHPGIDSIVADVVPLEPDDIAQVVQFVLDLPPRCAVNELVIRPADQAL